MTTLGGWNRVIVSGGFEGGEVWSTGVGAASHQQPESTGLSLFQNMQTAADGILAYIALNTGSLPFSGLSTSGWVDTVRVEYRDASNTLIQAAEAVSDEPLTGEPAPMHPTQNALVTSLMTGQPGRRYRGRMYWPLFTSAVTTSFRVATAVRDATATGTVAFLQEVGSQLSAGDLFVEASVVSLTGGVVTPVTAVRVGDVYDTQRRRRDEFVEQVITLPMSP